MSTDLSVRNFTPVAQRAADALLRSLGGFSVSLQMPQPPLSGDPAQVGVTVQGYQGLPLSPALFRRVRTMMREGEPTKFELMVSASAVQAQVSALQLTSADALFAMSAGVTVAGKFFLIEAISAPEAFGQAYVYRLQLREGLPQNPIQQ